MLYAGGVAGLIALAFWLFCLFDAIAAEPVLVRNLPKLFWVLLVVFLPIVGGVAWLVLGRPLDTRFVPGSTVKRRPSLPRSRGPDDDPNFLRQLGAPPRPEPLDERERRLQEWEDELRRRERELRGDGDDGAT